MLHDSRFCVISCLCWSFQPGCVFPAQLLFLSLSLSLFYSFSRSPNSAPIIFIIFLLKYFSTFYSWYLGQVGRGLTTPGVGEDNSLLHLLQRVRSLYLDTYVLSSCFSPFDFYLIITQIYNKAISQSQNFSDISEIV